MMDMEITEAIITSIFTFLGVVITVLGNLYNKSKKENEKIYSLPNINNHVLFINLHNYVLKTEYIEIKHVSQGKKTLAIDFLKNFILHWEDPCKDFAEYMEQYCNTNKDKDQDDICSEIYSHAIDLINKGIFSNDVNFLNNDDRLAYSIFNTKYKEWNADRIDRLTEKISKICLSNDTYKTAGFKSIRILECIDDFLYDTMIDATLTIMKINGELEGKVYKGYVL